MTRIGSRALTGSKDLRKCWYCIIKTPANQHQPLLLHQHCRKRQLWLSLMGWWRISTMGFNGARIALLESRLSGELATLIRNNGGDPTSAPSVKEVPLGRQHEVAAFIDRLTAGAYTFVLFMTGRGVNGLFNEVEGLGRLAGLVRAPETDTNDLPRLKTNAGGTA